MIDYSAGYIILLVTMGMIAGVINTLAGGGSNLTIPALMIMGLPADIANATNRVGVFLQSVVAIAGFKKHDKLDTSDIGPVLLPTLIGGVAGAIAASFSPEWILKPLLLTTMVGMALIILISPSTVMPEQGVTPKKVKDTPMAIVTLLIAGFYGGFVQAGVGFILIAALAGSLRYDLVRTNALKMVCTLAFTAMALVIFIWQDQILWLPGLILAAGTMIGAAIGVRMAIKVQATTLKWFLFVMTLFACGAALIF